MYSSTFVKLMPARRLHIGIKFGSEPKYTTFIKRYFN